MFRKLRALFKDERGQDFIEYALLASLIAVALVATVIFTGLVDALEAAFQSVVDAFP